MTDSFEWKILNLYREPSKGTVLSLNWALHGKRTLDSGKTYQTFVEGSISLNPVQEGTFIPYEDLTEEECLNWTKTYLALQNKNKTEEIQKAVSNRLNELENPTILPGKPWEPIPEDVVIQQGEDPNPPPGNIEDYTWSARDQKWILNSEFTERPEMPSDGKQYEWDDETGSWIEVIESV